MRSQRVLRRKFPVRPQTFSGIYRRTRQAHLDHEDAKAELKKLLPEHTKEAFGHGEGQALEIRRNQL
jgi:hypothetical protein